MTGKNNSDQQRANAQEADALATELERWCTAQIEMGTNPTLLGCALFGIAVDLIGGTQGEAVLRECVARLAREIAATAPALH